MTITKTIDLGSLEHPTWRGLRAFVDDIARREAANETGITVRIDGGKLSASVERALTIAEEAQEWQRRFESVGDQIRAVLPPNNAEPLSTSDRMALMKAIFAIVGEPGKPQTGSDRRGTDASAAGPAAPNAPTPPAPAPSDDERRGQFRTAAAMGGWKLPDDAATALKYARQKGMPDLTGAEVERWEGLPAGTLGA